MNNIDFRYDVEYTMLTNDPVEGAVACGMLPKVPEDVEHHLNYYSGLLVISGRGKYVSDQGETIDLGPGDFVQRRPGCKHRTIVEEGEPWLEFYICFGPSIYNSLVDMQMISNETVLKTALRPSTIGKCEALLLEFKRSTEKNKKMLLVALQSFLIQMNNLCEEPEKHAQVPQMIEAICDRLSKGFEERIDYEALAKIYKVSYESMRKTFKRYTGMAPNRYRLMMRINEAKRFLVDTDASLKYIAAELGYADQYAFSTQFKKVVGLSPKKYRDET